MLLMSETSEDVKYLNKFIVYTCWRCEISQKKIKGYVITLMSDISDMNTVYKVRFTLYYTSLTCIYVFAHNFLNIQWIFNLKKVLES